VDVVTQRGRPARSAIFVVRVGERDLVGFENHGDVRRWVQVSSHSAGWSEARQ